MKFRRVLAAKIALGILATLAALALWGWWVANNMYVTHNPTVAIGRYIDKTGKWPGSWEEVSHAGIELPYTVHRVEVAWHVDPYELLSNGKIMGETPLSDSYCSVVYAPRKKPDVSEIDWELHPILADALRAAKPTEQVEALKP